MKLQADLFTNGIYEVKEFDDRALLVTPYMFRKLIPFLEPDVIIGTTAGPVNLKMIERKYGGIWRLRK